MKKMLLGILIVLGTGGVAAAQATNQTYQDGIACRQVTARKAPSETTGELKAETGSLSLQCEAYGELTRNLVLTVFFDKTTGNITGGEWRLLVSIPDASGIPVESGTIQGDVSGGILGFDKNEKLISIDNAKLNIKGGEGSFAKAAGAGIISAVIDDENNQLKGGMSLAF